MLNFGHYMAYSGDKFTEANQYSEQMLDELEKEHLAVFSEPIYPI